MALRLFSRLKRRISREEDDEASERERIAIQNQKDALVLLDESLDSIQRTIKDLMAEAKMLRDFASHLPKNSLVCMELIRAANSIEKTADSLAKIKIHTFSKGGF